MAAPQLVDVDLDALATKPKTVRLGGEVFKLPGDMPLSLFFQLQDYEKRIEDGLDEIVLLREMSDELLALLQVHQPKVTKLPEMGLQTLIKALPAIYSGGAAVGEAQNRKTRRQKTRTASGSSKTTRAKATSR